MDGWKAQINGLLGLTSSYITLEKKKITANFLEKISLYFHMLISILIPVSRASWGFNFFFFFCLLVLIIRKITLLRGTMYVF